MSQNKSKESNQKSEQNQNEFSYQQKQYLYLSKKGRQKYMQISKKAYQTLLIWSVVGTIAGFTVYKYSPHVKFLRKFPRFGKTMFVLCSVMFSYHGYKLMGYTKKVGCKQLSKNPEYQLTRQEYEKQIKSKILV